jgi:hypothetical protein
LLVGGGEDLAISGGPANATLAITLADRLDRLHACVDDMIDSFVQAARAREVEGRDPSKVKGNEIKSAS